MVWTGDSRGRLAPSLIALIDQADTGWPHRSRISDGSIGDAAHASRASDHNPKSPNPPGWVDAVDITRDDQRGPNLDRLWNHLISRRDPRVKYLIYKGRIVKSYVDSAGHASWVAYPYTGANPHDKHLHVSVRPEGRADTSPWFPPNPPSEDDDDMAKPALLILRGVQTTDGKIGDHEYVVHGVVGHHIANDLARRTNLFLGAEDHRGNPVDSSAFHLLDGPLKTP